jgi:hypothetical protein
VRRYLGAVEAGRTPKAKKRPTEALTNRMRKIEELLVSADPLTKLHLTQERLDLHAEIVRSANGPEPTLEALEAEFVRVARPYSERTGVTFAAWRQVGVDPAVLERAGIYGRSRNGKEPRAGEPAEASEATDEVGAQPALDLDVPAVEAAEPTTDAAVAAPSTEPPAEADEPAAPESALDEPPETQPEPPPLRRRRVTEKKASQTKRASS